MTSLDLLPLSRRRLFALSLGAAAAASMGMPEAVFGQDATTYTFLVLGLDTREENEDQRSDIIMVSRVDLASNTVRTLSFPRDLYLEIPGYGMDKINAAYQRGLSASGDLDWEEAANLTAETITHNFGIDFDGKVMTDMNHFPAIIDAVGGVDVDNPYAVVDPTWEEASFPAGVIHLDGEQALVFTRTRKMDSDDGRVMRQHLVLEALLEKLQSPRTLVRLPQLMSSLSDAVKSDLSSDIQGQLIALLPQLSRDDLTFGNIADQLWADSTDSGAWIYQGDWNTLPEYVRSWLNGEIE